MDANATEVLISTVGLIATTLDAAPDSWRDHLQAVRNITASLELSDSVPDEVRRRWQVPLIKVFQRVAFADADNGGVMDVSNCKCTGQPSLRTLLTANFHRVSETSIDAVANLPWRRRPPYALVEPLKNRLLC